MKRMLGRLLAALVILVLALAVWFTKPWDDLQSWRWYTMMFEGPRAALFTHCEVIQPQGVLETEWGLGF